MFLAVPITMTLKIAFDSNSNSRWFGILMSDLSRKKAKKESKYYKYFLQINISLSALSSV